MIGHGEPIAVREALVQKPGGCPGVLNVLLG